VIVNDSGLQICFNRDYEHSLFSDFVLHFWNVNVEDQLRTGSDACRRGHFQLDRATNVTFEGRNATDHRSDDVLVGSSSTPVQGTCLYLYYLHGWTTGRLKS
jgi:hypothetical protein